MILVGELASSGPRADNSDMTKLYFIIGCTCSGKSGVGVELARRTGGEIVAADSMKVYRRMDIGTAKPSAEVRAEIRHHCIDIVEPSQGFSVAEYVRHADAAIEAIAAEGKVALVVGGTSLYVKALSEGMFDGPPADAELRADLKARAASEGLAKLHAELAGVDPQAAAAIHVNDERRIIRALEVYRTSGEPISALQQQWDSGRRRYDCVFIGVSREKSDLNGRINRRVKQMIEAGLVDEVAGLLAEPEGLSDQASAAVGYSEIIAHLRGKFSLDAAIEKIKINTRRLAKNQRTWHRRSRDVHWVDASVEDTAGELAERILGAISFDTSPHRP